MQSRLLRLLILCACSTLLWGCKQHNYEQQGYVEGDYSYVAPNYAGILQQLMVTKGEHVKKGDLLFVLEQEPEADIVKQNQSNIVQAQAQTDQARAAVVLAGVRLQRQQDLYLKKAGPKEDLDTARANYDEAQAALAAAIANLQTLKATLVQSNWQLQKKTVLSPDDGLVFDTFFYPGEYIAAGQPVLALLTPENIYVVFYIPEPLLSSVFLGKKAEVSCDGCSEPLTVTIKYISPQAEYTPPVIFSNDTRDKLLYRIEAAPVLAKAYSLHPGQPVIVKLSDATSSDSTPHP